MISLSKAFRLCGISREEYIWIRTPDNSHDEMSIMSRAVIERFDLKKLSCTKITPNFSWREGSFIGFIFTIPELTIEDIHEADKRYWRKEYRKSSLQRWIKEMDKTVENLLKETKKVNFKKNVSISMSALDKLRRH